MNAIDRLTALRPTDTTVDRLWSPQERAAALERVLDTGPVPVATRRSRRPLAIGLAAAAVAVVAIAVPLALPVGAPGGASPAAAAELDRLATVAASAPFDTAGPDDVLHLVVVDHQTSDGTAVEDPAGTDVRTLESWTTADGTTWRKDTEAGEVRYYQFAPGGDYTAAPSPAYLASLPTDPDALRSYLRSHVSGSSSTDEAVFTAVGDMLRGGFAPPALRVAALDVLKHTDHVTLGDATADELGRPVVEVDFVDQAKRADAVQALYFATDTAEIVQEADRWPGMDFRSVVQSSEVVAAVPDELLDKAVAQG